ncbi:MAG TPA: M1 family peptidase, partial [Actinomycetota bacterium]|nr:M1 family peptidase [Actinomycetota bacterium]
MRAERILAALAIVASAVLVAPGAGSAPGGLDRCGPDASAGTLGVGDRYFPRFGNGGYDVQHYDLAIRYGPRTN